jgi:ATP-dependent protease ClpP protease subunit
MAEIQIYGDIGEAWWWDEESITGATISAQLKEIPEGEPIDLRINSEGGAVGEALAIYNLLKGRGNITTYIDGYACSAASFIALAGDRIIAPRSSIIMIHNPHTIEWGDANAMRKCADMLDVHRDATLSIYTEASGKSEEEIIALLDAETWMTGEEAAELGFVDEVTEEKPVENRFPNRVKCSAKDQKRFKTMGWSFDRVAASVRSPKKVTPIKEEKPVVKVDEDQTPLIADVMGQTKELQAVVDRLTGESITKDDRIATLEREKAEIENRANVTASWQSFRSTAEGLVRDLKMSPPEFEALFDGDRASADKLLQSPDCSQHLFYLRETLASAGRRSPGLQTGFRVNEFEDKGKGEESTSKADSFLETMPKVRTY